MICLARYGLLALTTYATLCRGQSEGLRNFLTTEVAQSPEQHGIKTSTASLSSSKTVETTSIQEDTDISPTSTTINPTSSSSSTFSTGTCQSKTVNYITHTLAQQCLRADWTRTRGSSSDQASSAPNGTSTVKDAVQSSNITVSTTSVSPTDSPSGVGNHSDAAPTSVTSPVNIDITETDVDSPLDTANFLSFEDWKKQNLAKAGQSGDTFSLRDSQKPTRRAPDINALDSLGEESEIELDFAGFGTPVVPQLSQSSADSPVDGRTSSSAEDAASPSQALRPDAGKTCKERTNYASFDCAATILKSNPECKSASSVLVENKDSYMLNKCSAENKFFIVELCNDILVDTVVLANYEFFSSIFRTFRVSVSDRYPTKAEKWKDLGTFEARNTREVQAFLVENPLIWARYLRIEFLTHYGAEYYCPVSLLRVHGTTMMEEFRNQEEVAREESPQEQAVLEKSEEVKPTPMPITIEPTPTTTKLDQAVSDTLPAPSNDSSSAGIETSNIRSEEPTGVLDSVVKAITTTSSAANQISEQHRTGVSDDDSATITAIHISSIESTSTNTSLSTASQTSDAGVANTTPSTSSENDVINPPTTAINTSTSAPYLNSTSVQQSDLSYNTNATAAANNTAGSEASIRETKSVMNATKSVLSTAQQPQPSTQESIFKSIAKRLQQLESNSTLSLQYIEDQSRILRDAFNKVEKRQVGITTKFLANLNTTVMSELTGFRQAYDQLWQSTVIELEGQREQHHQEMNALSSRLTLVVDELVWQKRMGIIQSTLLLLCLGFVLFARSGNGSLEASLMQHVMARSQAAFGSGTGSDQNSPASPGRSPVALIRRKLPLWRTAGPVAEVPEDSSPVSAPMRMHSQVGMTNRDKDVDFTDHLSDGDRDDNTDYEDDDGTASNISSHSEGAATRGEIEPQIRAGMI